MSLNKLIIVALLAFFTTACSNKKITRHTTTPKKLPTWVKNRPVVSGHYTGVGAAKIDPSGVSHIEIAKSNALNDLVSEIEVTISGNTMIQQFENDVAFKEEYNSMTKASIRDKIEGYELVDSWGDGNYYWVYYKLSKAHYQEIKNRQLLRAKALATDFYNKGLEKKNANEISAAITYFMKGINELKYHLDEKILLDDGMSDDYLINALLTELIDIFNKTQIKPDLYSVTTKMSQPINKLVNFQAIYNNQHPLKSMPFHIYFIKGDGEVTEHAKTNESGEGSFKLGKITGTSTYQELMVTIDVKLLFDESAEDVSILEKLISINASIPSAVMHITVTPIIAYFDPQEIEFDRPSERNMITNEIKKLLAEKNYTFTDTLENSDVTVSLNSRATKGKHTERHNLYTVYIDCYLSVKDTKRGTKVFFKGLDQIRGQQVESWNNALKVAQKELLNQFQKSIIPEITNISY